MNKKLFNLFKSDQADRAPDKIRSYDAVKNGWKRLMDADIRRLKEVRRILKTDKNLNAEDYFHAAMVFQHGQKLSDYKMAASLAKTSAELGDEKAKWLYAAATDRLLVNLGRKQKYGTQYQKESGKWVLMPVDRRTSDHTRTKYNVPNLREAKARARVMNKI